MNLTPVQMEVLLALVDLYYKSNGDAVKVEGIVTRTDILCRIVNLCK